MAKDQTAVVIPFPVKKTRPPLPTPPRSAFPAPVKTAVVYSAKAGKEAKVRLFQGEGLPSMIEYTSFEGRRHRLYVEANKAEKKFDKLLKALEVIRHYEAFLPT